MVLNSSLASIVAVGELTMITRQIASKTFRTLETWFLTGVIYFIITLLLSRGMQYLEKKYSIPGLGVKRL